MQKEESRYIAKHKERFCLSYTVGIAPPFHHICQLRMWGTMVSSMIRGRKLSVTNISPSVYLLSALHRFLLALTGMLVEGNGARSSHSSQSQWSVLQRHQRVTAKECAWMYYFTDFPGKSVLNEIYVNEMRRNIFVWFGDSQRTTATCKARSRVPCQRHL